MKNNVEVRLALLAVLAVCSLHQGAIASEQCARNLVISDEYLEFIRYSHEKPENEISAKSHKVFNPCWYMSLSAGQSNVGPDDPGNGWRVAENHDNSGKFVLGLQFSPRWFAEISYADLGAAKLDDDNANTAGMPRMDYTVPALGIGHWFREPQNSFNYYMKFGVALVQGQIANPFVDVEESNEIVANFGLGAQWRFQNNWFTRMEIDYYDQDESTYYGLGFGRFFGKDREQHIPEPDAGPRPEMVVRKLKPLTIAEIKPQSASGSCHPFKEDFSEVDFRVASEYLSKTGKRVLASISSAIVDRPDLRMEIQAVNDTLDDEWDNLLLSDAQAKAVRDHLVKLGVPEIQLSYKGYGQDLTALENTNTNEQMTAIGYKVIQEACSSSI